MSTFKEMLRHRWNKGCHLCVGLDSKFEKIPTHLREAEITRIGRLATTFNFNKAIIDAVHPHVCAFKPNIAFFTGKTRLQSEASRDALHFTIDYIHKTYPGIPVILDFKRGDIGNTNIGYVDEAFSEFDADAITVSPYFGQESLTPFLEKVDKGIIVLCRTSNVGATEFQNQHLAFKNVGEIDPSANTSPETLLPIHKWNDSSSPHFLIPFYQYIALRVSRHWNKRGNCALVVGATAPEELSHVREIVGDMPILIPGIGTQGGDFEATVKAGMDSTGAGMIINSSSAIIFASSGKDFAEAASREAQKTNDAVKVCIAENFKTPTPA